MKRTTKLLTALCAFVLVMQASLTAMAATYTLTLNNTGATQHTFEVYQIFTGDLSLNASSQRVLSNIVWGSGVTAAGQAAMGSAADKAETILTEADASAFANALVGGTGYLAAPLTQVVAAGSAATITGLDPGYYLIKDLDASQSGESSAYTAYMLEVVGDATATTKLSTPTVTKKVQDINNTGDGDISDNPWQDSADHDIGDTIPYQITGTLPSNFADYATYYYQFSDTMSAGLTYQADARVFVDGTDVTSQVVLSPTVVTPGATLTVTIPDLKALTGVTPTAASTVTVSYTAVLNSSAVTGSAGNANTVYLTYSNNPNPGGGGETGTTPTDKNVVFTYQFVVNKVDESNTPLPNAGFTLYKKDASGTWQVVETIAAGAATTFTFKGLDDGDYKLEETEVPTGFNKISDVEFSISATHDTTSPDPTLTNLNGATADGDTINLTATQQATVSLSTGTISVTIQNKAGSVLPSTGGIGTTIFYAVGGVLVVGAAVLLIVKRRMKAEE